MVLVVWSGYLSGSWHLVQGTEVHTTSNVVKAFTHKHVAEYPAWEQQAWHDCSRAQSYFSWLPFASPRRQLATGRVWWFILS